MIKILFIAIAMLMVYLIGFIVGYFNGVVDGRRVRKWK
jgi:ABC-type dipeptide/oligopeptide/nickel transport system permease subunit